MAHYEAESLKRLVEKVVAHKQVTQTQQQTIGDDKQAEHVNSKPVTSPIIPPNVPLLKDMPKRS